MGCKSMPFAGTGTQKCRFLSIDGEITYDTIEETKTQMVKAVKKEVSYIINLGGVSECDMVGIQLVLSLLKDLKHRELTFTLQEISPQVTELLTIAGITLPESSEECFCSEVN